MAGRNYQQRVPHVQPGSPVSAANTSASTRALESRTNYIKEILDAIEAGRLLVQRDRPVNPDVLEGQAVYWDDQTKQFDLAQATVENDSATGSLVPTKRADAMGIVLFKTNASTAIIGTVGMARFTPEQLTNMVDGTPVPGRYYLSAAYPGRLVKQRPPVTVAVAYILGPADDCETDSWVFILPQMRDFLEDHIHFQIELVARPAGTHVPPTLDEAHVITDADATLRGWLPADDPSFNGTAPAGAKFGYNLRAHAELNRNWPPIPVEAALLELYTPTWDNDFPRASRVLPEYLKMDAYGIWWMTDCYNSVPWPVDLDTTQASSSSSSSSSSMAATCPTASRMRLILSFIKMTFCTNRTVVTSLQPDQEQPIEFVNCDGDPANTGDLFARLRIAAMLDPADYTGGRVFKRLLNSNLRFGLGWVAEGLVAGNDRITLNGSHQVVLPGGAVLHQGIVEVVANVDPRDIEIDPQIIRLGDALEREYKHITYLAFPYGRDSAIRMRFNIPPVGLPNNPRLKLRALMFGRDDGPWAAMTASYYRVLKPVTGTPTPIASGDTTITFDVVTPTTNYDGNNSNLPVDQAILVESGSFVIAPGETIFIQLGRASDAGPLFESEIGVIRAVGVIVAGG